MMISIIFSFRNEEENLKELIDRVTLSMSKLEKISYELIFVNDDSNDTFSVNIIPFTWSNTIMMYYKIGTMVNIEIDRIALHVEKLIQKK